MPGVRSLVTRVGRLEHARAPALSPISAAWGSFGAFATWADEQVAAGVLDALDFPNVVTCLARWEREGTWGKGSSPAAVWRS